MSLLRSYLPRNDVASGFCLLWDGSFGKLSYETESLRGGPKADVAISFKLGESIYSKNHPG